MIYRVIELFIDSIFDEALTKSFPLYFSLPALPLSIQLYITAIIYATMYET